MGNKTKVSVIGLEGADMAMRVSIIVTIILYYLFGFEQPITARQRSLGKLMFSKVSVCPGGGEVRYLWSHVPSGYTVTHPLPWIHYPLSSGTT